MKRGLVIMFMLSMIGIVIMNEFSQQPVTARVVDDFGILRENRINLYLNFPNVAITVDQQRLVDNVRKILLFNSQGAYYMPYGLYDSVVFFNYERELIDNLMILACQKEPSFINYQLPLPITSQVHCDETLRSVAVDTLFKVVSNDASLIETTALASSCPDAALDKISLARSDIGMHRFESAIDNLQSAYIVSLGCYP